MGEILKSLEVEWIEANFAIDRDALLARAAALAKT